MPYPSSGTRWLVTGARGQLGSDLVTTLERDGATVTGLGRAELDITDPAAVDAAMSALKPDVVVNAAGYTAVDRAESDRQGARAGNVTGPAFLAERCAGSGSALLHVSTDYVFDGAVPDSDGLPVGAPTAPRSVYGATKLAGERAVLAACPRAYVVRTAWLYGAGGGNFVKTMARRAGAGAAVDVVDDQRGSPTWSRDLAGGLAALGRQVIEGAAEPGRYHCVNAGETTWYGLARAVYEETGTDPELVRAMPSSKLDRPAPRPACSVLSMREWVAAGLPAPRHWRDALRAAFAAVGDALRG